MLKACAYVVGPDDGPGAALRDLARDLGFPVVLPFHTVAAAEAQSQQTPLLFCLVAAVDDVRILKGVADQVRFAPARRIRFSPLVYFSESPSREAIARCIEMGFDDVITLPFTGPRVLGRITRLVDHTQIYQETAGYLGPERPSRHGIGQFRRLEFIRSCAAGTSILRDEMRVAV
jgi:DNA-binding response OmpR family regulator